MQSLESKRFLTPQLFIEQNNPKRDRFAAAQEILNRPLTVI